MIVMEAQYSTQNAAAVEISGRVIAAGIRKLGPHHTSLTRILGRYCEKQLRVDRWYPRNHIVNGLHDIGTEIGPRTVYTLGKAAWTALSPLSYGEKVIEMEICLRQLDTAYQSFHRYNAQSSHRDAIGNITVERTGKFTARATCDSPYPTELLRGFITQGLRQAEPNVSVAVLSENPPYCVFEIYW